MRWMIDRPKDGPSLFLEDLDGWKESDCAGPEPEPAPAPGRLDLHSNPTAFSFVRQKEVMLETFLLVLAIVMAVTIDSDHRWLAAAPTYPVDPAPSVLVVISRWEAVDLLWVDFGVW